MSMHSRTFSVLTDPQRMKGRQIINFMTNNRTNLVIVYRINGKDQCLHSLKLSRGLAHWAYWMAQPTANPEQTKMPNADESWVDFWSETHENWDTRLVHLSALLEKHLRGLKWLLAEIILENRPQFRQHNFIRLPMLTISLWQAVYALYHSISWVKKLSVTFH